MTRRPDRAAAAGELQEELRDLLCLAVAGDHIRWVLAGEGTAELAGWPREAVAQWRVWADQAGSGAYYRSAGASASGPGIAGRKPPSRVRCGSWTPCARAWRHSWRIWRGRAAAVAPCDPAMGRRSGGLPARPGLTGRLAASRRRR